MIEEIINLSPMSLDLALALAGFAFVMSASPGPGNFLLLVSGTNFGFYRSRGLIFGISFGFLSMVLAVGLGLGQILEIYPITGQALKVICFLYVLFLAWKIANAAPSLEAQHDQVSQPIGFGQAALFQLVNPKAWAVALIVTVSYTNPERYVDSLLALIALFALINLPTISLWALGGVMLRHLLAKPSFLRAFNIVMALLLVISMAPVVFSFEF